MDNSRKYRYLLAGAWNTLFGYGFGLVLYSLLYKNFHIVFIAIVGNIIAITMTFITYRFFVFKSKKHWVIEYLRCYVVYGASSILSVLLIWIMVDLFEVRFWISQAIVMMIVMILSFTMHSKYTFKGI